jgi:hypothetical protein
VKLAIRDNPLDAASHFLLGGLLEAVLFILTGLDQENVGFNFLKRVNANFNCFDSGNKIAGTGYAAPPALTGLEADHGEKHVMPGSVIVPNPEPAL